MKTTKLPGVTNRASDGAGSVVGKRGSTSTSTSTTSSSAATATGATAKGAPGTGAGAALGLGVPAPTAQHTAPRTASLQKALQAFDGSFDKAFPLVGDLVWLAPQELLGLVLDKKALTGAGRVLAADVLVSRAAELDPSAWKQIVPALEKERGGPVAEDLAEALIALVPSLDKKQRAALKKELARPSLARDDVGGSVKARLALLAGWLDSAAVGNGIPTKPLRNDAVVPLSLAETHELKSVVAVDDEATVNAKIPADLKPFGPFTRDYFSKGWVGDGKPGRLVCDTGNALEPGVTDHHQLGERTCAAALVLNRAELIVAHHQKTPITELVCHSSPDLDAVSSVFFAELLLRDKKLPPGTSRLAAYVSLEDNARAPVGDGDPQKHLATLCREAALQLAKKRHPSPTRETSPEVQRARDDEVLTVVKGILAYVLASGKDPSDESLFSGLDKIDPAILPRETARDIEALQALVAEAELVAQAQLQDVVFADGKLPRLDGKGTLAIHLAKTPVGGKRLDATLRERHHADVVVIACDDYTWTAAEPTSGASLRPIASAYEALERQRARDEGVDRLPQGEGERLQPGYSVKNPYYIGGTDTFIITPRGALLTTADRVKALESVAKLTWETPA